MKKEDFENCISLSDICKILKFPINGTGISKARKIVKELEIDMTKFKKGRKFQYELLYKICPICKKEFIVRKNKDKATCSYGCSNTYFKSGENHGSYKGTTYRQICFKNHKKECVICKENLIVEVHHYDENHENNSPENLIPLCPTHHQYYHSKYRYLVKDTIELYIKNFISKK